MLVSYSSHYYSTLPYDPAWDEGVRWHLEQAAADAPDYALDPLDLDFILTHSLKSAHPEAEATYVNHLRKVTLQEAERCTNRAILPQWWTLVMDRFPTSGILLPKPPLIQVESITWLDADGDSQVYTGSPAEYVVDAPSGPRARAGRVFPVSGAQWPAVSIGSGAVAVRFQAGYPGSPPAIPDEIQHARLISINEMHKQRSESVHISQSRALRTARLIYAGYKVY